MGIHLVTRTVTFFVRFSQRGKLRDALLKSRDALLPIRIGEELVDVLVRENDTEKPRRLGLEARH